jgi:polynucleotide 5'-kinase involved in rRNA processing
MPHKNTQTIFCADMGRFKVLGMSSPISLQNLYTEVHIISPEYRSKDRISYELEDKFRRTRGNCISSEHRMNAIIYSNQKDRLNVLGAPDSGKSTLLQK